MAYAAVISLKHTTNALLNSSRISLVSSSQILELAYNQTTSLQKVLQKFNNSKRLDDVDRQIRDAANKLEDVLEFHELNSQEEDKYEAEEVRKEITPFLERVKKLEAEYIEEIERPVSEEDDNDVDDASVSPNFDVDVEMVGHYTDFTSVRDNLLQKMRPDDMCFFSYVGETGSGRSIVAKTLFEDEKQRFDCGAWVTVGTKYQKLKEIAIHILHQVDNDQPYEFLLLEEDEKIILDYLYRKLENRRYLIVLDDVRSAEVLDYLKSSFPDQSNGSLIYVTTSLTEVADSVQCLHTVRSGRAYLENSSWYMLKSALFGRNVVSISPDLEEAGKLISENCRSRCIALAKTLLFLTKTEKAVEVWRKIAADKEHPIFMIENEFSEICKIKTEMQSHKWNMDDKREGYTVRLISGWIDISSTVARIKREMQPKRFFSKMQIISLWGMAGIGKTTYAKKAMQDKSILCHFDHCVWVTLGPKYQAEEILIDLLAQIYQSADKKHMKEDEEFVRELCVQLSDKRCLIVVDDLWSKEPLHHLKRLFPHIKGRALVTTRLEEATIWGEGDICFDIRFLDKEESWTLLRQKVFGDEVCPFELEKVGRKIVENCDCLPLLILKVADQLLKVEKKPEIWNRVASGKESSVFTNAHDEISKALLPSYKILPQHLKACFLYIGVFRKRYDISTSKLTDLLIAEGFLEQILAECLTELESKSVVMVQHGPPTSA